MVSRGGLAFLEPGESRSFDGRNVVDDIGDIFTVTGYQIIGRRGVGWLCHVSTPQGLTCASPRLMRYSDTEPSLPFLMLSRSLASAASLEAAAWGWPDFTIFGALRTFWVIAGVCSCSFRYAIASFASKKNR